MRGLAGLQPWTPFAEPAAEDPIFAAIELYRQATSEEARAARAALANTAPTTLAGLRAYLDFVLDESAHLEELMFDGDEETQDFVRSLARTAALI